LNKKGEISLASLIEFYIIESWGKDILNFFNKTIGKFQIVEHFHTFFRLKVDEGISVGKIFGLFEANKKDLNIDYYEIK